MGSSGWDIERHVGDTKEEMRKYISLNTGLARHFPRGFYQDRNVGMRLYTTQPLPGSTFKVLSWPVVKPTNRTIFNSV